MTGLRPQIADNSGLNFEELSDSFRFPPFSEGETWRKQHGFVADENFCSNKRVAMVQHQVPLTSSTNKKTRVPRVPGSYIHDDFSALLDHFSQQSRHQTCFSGADMSDHCNKLTMAYVQIYAGKVEQRHRFQMNCVKSPSSIQPVKTKLTLWGSEVHLAPTWRLHTWCWALLSIQLQSWVSWATNLILVVDILRPVQCFSFMFTWDWQVWGHSSFFYFVQVQKRSDSFEWHNGLKNGNQTACSETTNGLPQISPCILISRFGFNINRTIFFQCCFFSHLSAEKHCQWQKADQKVEQPNVGHRHISSPWSQIVILWNRDIRAEYGQGHLQRGSGSPTFVVQVQDSLSHQTILSTSMNRNQTHKELQQEPCDKRQRIDQIDLLHMTQLPIPDFGHLLLEWQLPGVQLQDLLKHFEMLKDLLATVTKRHWIWRKNYCSTHMTQHWYRQMMHLCTHLHPRQYFVGSDNSVVFLHHLYFLYKNYDILLLDRTLFSKLPAEFSTATPGLWGQTQKDTCGPFVPRVHTGACACQVGVWFVIFDTTHLQFSHKLDQKNTVDRNKKYDHCQSSQGRNADCLPYEDKRHNQHQWKLQKKFQKLCMRTPLPQNHNVSRSQDGESRLKERCTHLIEKTAPRTHVHQFLGVYSH